MGWSDPPGSVHEAGDVSKEQVAGAPEQRDDPGPEFVRGGIIRLRFGECVEMLGGFTQGLDGIRRGEEPIRRAHLATLGSVGGGTPDRPRRVHESLSVWTQEPA